MQCTELRVQANSCGMEEEDPTSELPQEPFARGACQHWHVPQQAPELSSDSW